MNQLTGTVLMVDGVLTYAPGDPGTPTHPSAGGTIPSVAASSYTTSRTGPVAATQLFGIDSARDSLVLRNPPNEGTLTTVGSLGVNTGEPVSFDITAGGTAYGTARDRRPR